MLTRERVLANRDAIGAGGEHWARMIKLFIAMGFPDTVYSIGGLKRDRQALAKGIDALRKVGVAEADYE
jgi:hypothetical protein